MTNLKGELAAQVASSLQGRMGARVKDLRIDFHDRGLILRGLARTYYAKQLAQHAVMEFMGLPILANEIEVLGQMAQTYSEP